MGKWWKLLKVFKVSIQAEEMITLLFMDRNKMKMRLMLWFVIKIIYGIYMKVERATLLMGMLRVGFDPAKQSSDW